MGHLSAAPFPLCSSVLWSVDTGIVCFSIWSDQVGSDSLGMDAGFVSPVESAEVGSHAEALQDLHNSASETYHLADAHGAHYHIIRSLLPLVHTIISFDHCNGIDLGLRLQGRPRRQQGPAQGKCSSLLSYLLTMYRFAAASNCSPGYTPPKEQQCSLSEL